MVQPSIPAVSRSEPSPSGSPTEAGAVAEAGEAVVMMIAPVFDISASDSSSSELE